MYIVGKHNRRERKRRQTRVIVQKPPRALQVVPTPLRDYTLQPMYVHGRKPVRNREHAGPNFSAPASPASTWRMANIYMRVPMQSSRRSKLMSRRRALRVKLPQSISNPPTVGWQPYQPWPQRGPIAAH